MRVCLMIEGQEGVSWNDWRALANAAEAAGLDGLFRSDHYSSFHAAPGDALDAWSTIAALSALTQRLRLGTLVSPVMFRHPSVLARMSASADQISGGRIEVGLGSGWHEPEHLQNGFAFPDLRSRFDVLTEQLEILVRSWSGERFDYRGEHYALRGQRALPRPVQVPHPPIILGGQGRPRALDLAVRFAREYNTMGSVAECRARRGLLDQACRRAGRDPASLALSVMGFAALGESAADAADRERRALECIPGSRHLFAQASGKFVGGLDAVATLLRDYAAAGVSRVYLNHFDRRDLRGIELMGRLARAVAS